MKIKNWFSKNIDLCLAWGNIVTGYFFLFQYYVDNNNLDLAFSIVMFIFAGILLAVSDSIREVKFRLR